MVLHLEKTDLHSKHRGLAQVKAYRSAKWIKDCKLHWLHRFTLDFTSDLNTRDDTAAVSGLVKAKHKFEVSAGYNDMRLGNTPFI